MQLPYNRPRLIEIHDQEWCPVQIRAQCQSILTFLWNTRIFPFQPYAPYEPASDILEGVVRDLEDDEEGTSRSPEKGKGRLRIVDCCSGAGGPMPAIERRINQRRRSVSRAPLPVVLSDLHPHLPSWTRHACASQTSSLTFLPYSVDATHAPIEVRRGKHIRTFCLSFHHFGEEGARRVLEDAMRTAEAICIFELQEFDLGSLLTILAIFPLTYLVTPFTRPSLLVLFLTYIIPVIPIIMTLDGLISAYRTRTLSHIKYLASLASLSLSLEGGDGDCGEWSWEEGRRKHTRPFGNMYYIIGRRLRGEWDDEDTVDSEVDGFGGVI